MRQPNVTTRLVYALCYNWQFAKDLKMADQETPQSRTDRDPHDIQAENHRLRGLVSLLTELGAG